MCRCIIKVVAIVDECDNINPVGGGGGGGREVQSTYLVCLTSLKSEVFTPDKILKKK